MTEKSILAKLLKIICFLWFLECSFSHQLFMKVSLSATELNHDLKLIQDWAHQWKMAFNPDPNKQAVELIFSHKKTKPIHPPLFFNGVIVKPVDKHKHLGLTFDSKLTFTYHINEKIAIAKKGIGIIKYLSSFTPIKTLDQIYKMFVRPHLDYCNVIYQIPPTITGWPHLLKNLKTPQIWSTLLKNLKTPQICSVFNKISSNLLKNYFCIFQKIHYS